MLTKIVKDTWQKGQVTSTLFLDVKGAFPSVDTKWLFHIEWIERQLGNRHTTLSFDNYQTEIFTVLNGLDQGDPFSAICYLIYNADLLEIPDVKNREWILLFMDDAAVIVIGKNFMETREKLWNIMN